MSNSALNELGFAEFVAKLISDTFSAILSSQAEQQDKMAEIRNLLAMDEDAFVDMSMQDDALLAQLEIQLQLLFGSDAEPGHLVFDKAEYQPKTERKQESPAYFIELGLVLVEGVDYKSRKLMLDGVSKIKRALMARVASQQRDSLALMVADGIPRLVVDSGKINAKLTFATELFDEGDTDTTPSTSTSGLSTGSLNINAAVVKPASLSGLNLSNRFVGMVDTKRLLNTRLKITPASNKAPQDAQTSANIYSEVEIHFKTIL